jgi:putative glycosyltransferase (TIGR04372 family)
MKVLISTAIWGEDYCSVFTKFSLASLLCPENIPELATRASLTCHIVTTRSDRRLLRSSPAIRELGRYCTIEWELVDDYMIYRPPTGPGGEKYPFLGALQNLAIARSLDHDAIVFNYADFIWGSGSLSAAVDMLFSGEKAIDGVLAFCFPVDRDSAMPDLDEYRSNGEDGPITLPPRDAARITIERMHREARNRFWDAPRFTNLPSYIMWPVDDAGVVLRAYHQSILAMRVRPDDPQFERGIAMGGLDSAFTAQLAKSGTLAFANDTDKVLVFSLYHTPVDSRLPPGVTREMSLRDLLHAIVIPEQRRFATFPFFFRLHEGRPEDWQRVAEESRQILQEFEDSTAFDQTAHEELYKTHGVIPKIIKAGVFRRYVVLNAYRFLTSTGIWQKLTRSARRVQDAAAAGRRIAFVLSDPSRLIPAIERRSALWRRMQRILFVLSKPTLLNQALTRRWHRLSFVLRHPQLWRATAQSRQQTGLVEVTPNVWITPDCLTRFNEAIAVEGSSRSVADDAGFVSALRLAEASLRHVIKSAPLWIEAVRALGRNLWFQGRFNEAIQTFAAAERLRDKAAVVAGWPVDSCLFLPRNCVEVIGLMGHIEAFVKHKILTADPRTYYLLAPAHDVVNNVFLDYWKDYITIVSQPEEIARLARQEPVYGVNWNWVMPQDGEITFVHAAMAAAQRDWQHAGRGPLLHLRQDHANVLHEARRKWGMRAGERFVCLHVRSEGFYGKSNEHAQQFRNTTIDSYYPMIAALQEKGIWVVRMGDASMPPLNTSRCGGAERVVDYALSADKSAALDVALCAECVLFVSSPSGLHGVAHAFGRPVCEVNYPIYNGFPWHPTDIFVPRLYFSHKKGRVLRLEEILGTDVVHLDHQFLLDRAGISLVPNEPDDITETVLEALAESSYQVADEDLAERVCAAFAELNYRYKVGISGRLGRYFAAKYAARLLGTAEARRMMA